MSAVASSKPTTISSASPMSSPTSAPPPNVALAIPATNSNNCQGKVDTTSGKSTTISSASPMSSPTFTPSQEVLLATRIAPTEHPLETPARCSMNGLALDTGFLKSLTVSWTSSTTSTTSAPTQDVSSPTLIVSSEKAVATHTKYSMSGRSCNLLMLALEAIPAIAPTLTTSTPMFKSVNFSSVSPVGVAQLCLNTNTGSTHELFEVLSLSLCVLSVDDSQCTMQLLPKPPWSLVCSEIGFPCVFMSAAVCKGPEIFSYPTAQFACFSNCMEWHLSWPPPFMDHVKGIKYELLSIYCLSLQLSEKVVVVMSPSPPPQSTLMQFQLCATCVLGVAVSKCMVRLLHLEMSWDYLKHWFELVARVVQVDACHIRETVGWSELNHTCWTFHIYKLANWVLSVKCKEKCRGAPLFHRTCLSELCIQEQEQTKLSFSELMVARRIILLDQVTSTWSFGWDQIADLCVYSEAHKLEKCFDYLQNLYATTRKTAVDNKKTWHSILHATVQGFLVQWDPGGFEALHCCNLIGLWENEIRMTNNTCTSFLMDLNGNIPWENRQWCSLLCSSQRVKERLTVLQLFACCGTSCSILKVVSALRSQVHVRILQVVSLGIPTSLQFFKSPTLQCTAWGQAVFQEGKYVRDLIGYLLGWPDWRSKWAVTPEFPGPRRKTRDTTQYKYRSRCSDGGVEDQTTEPAASSCSRRAFARGALVAVTIE